MASEVIQFREAAEFVAEIRQAGLNPNEFARQALEEAWRRRKARERFDRIRRIVDRNAQQAGPPADIVAMIREDRERGHE